MGPRQLVIHECKVLWKYLSEHGGSKEDAIGKLYAMGELSQDNYECDCPLCERYDSLLNYINCTGCPWPGRKGNYVRCLDSKSPFRAWGMYMSKKNAKKVYDLVKTFK